MKEDLKDDLKKDNLKKEDMKKDDVKKEDMKKEDLKEDDQGERMLKWAGKISYSQFNCTFEVR